MIKDIVLSGLQSSVCVGSRLGVMTLRRILSLALACSLLAGIVLGVIDRSLSGPSNAAPPKEPRPILVAANGVTEGARPEVPVRPEVTGTLVAIHAREGCQVRMGGLLVMLENGTQQSHVSLAEAELASARAILDRLRNGERQEKRDALAAVMRSKQALFEQAKAIYERSQRAGSSVSREQLERESYHMLSSQADWKAAQLEFAVVDAPAREDEERGAEARVRSAEAQLRKAQVDLEKTRLRAPFACRVLRIHAEVGQLVGPQSQQPLIVIADVSQYRVRAFVEELNVFKIAVGQKAFVTADGLPGREFTGLVCEVLPGMGRRAVQSEAPGEYKDVYYREALIELDAGAEELPLNLRVRTWIDIPHAP